MSGSSGVFANIGQIDDRDILSVVDYYCRKRYYGVLERFCTKRLEIQRNNSRLKFWKALATVLRGTGPLQDAIRDLEELQNNQVDELELAVPYALLDANMKCALPDPKTVAMLRGQVEASELASQRARFMGANVLFHVGRFAEAGQLIDRLLKEDMRSDLLVDATVLSGWIQVANAEKIPGEGVAVGAFQFFCRPLGENPPDNESDAGGVSADFKAHLGASLGRVAFFETLESHAEAENALNQIIVRWSWFEPALAEKACIMMLRGDWGQAVQTAGRVADPTCFDALRLVVTYMMSQSTVLRDVQNVQRNLGELRENLLEFEEHNHELLFEAGRLFSRLADGNETNLNECTYLVELALAAIKDKPASTDVSDPDWALFEWSRPNWGALRLKYDTEYAYQIFLRGAGSSAPEEAYEQARDLYDKAMDAANSATDMVDMESNVALGLGYVECLLALGQDADAQEHLSIQREVQETLDAPNPHFDYFEGISMRRQMASGAESAEYSSEVSLSAVVALFRGAYSQHMTEVTDSVGDVVGFEFLATLDAPFIEGIGQELLLLCPREPQMALVDSLAEDTASEAISAAQDCLGGLVNLCPGLLRARVLHATALYVGGRLSEARTVLDAALVIQPEDAEAEVLAAQISIAEQDYVTAQAHLESALAHDFLIRDSQTYGLANTRLLMATEKWEDVLTTLQHASEAARKSGRVVSTRDRASMALDTVTALRKLNKVREARKLLKKVNEEFGDTAEASRFAMMNSEFALEKGETDRAVRILKEIPQSSPHYTQACNKIADILLNKKNNKAEFVQVYKDLAAARNTAASQVLVGDAYMKVQRPGQAIEAYGKAIVLLDEQAGKSPSGKGSKSKAAKPAPGGLTVWALKSKIGRAQTVTHDYKAAIAHYKAAVESPGAPLSLRLDYGRLLFKLERFEDAFRVLKGSGDSVGHTSESVDYYILLAKTQRALEMEPEQPHASLMRALDLQKRLLSKRHQVQLAPDQAKQHKSRAAEVSRMIAESFRDYMRNPQQASFYFDESLSYEETDEKSIMALAHYQYDLGELDACQEACVKLLKIDSANEKASMLLADVMFQKGQYDRSIAHFQNLVKEHPTKYSALCNLIRLLRKTGKLVQVKKYFEDKEVKEMSHKAGFNFCRGLYLEYTNKTEQAVKQFNLCRRDAEWGSQALKHLVHLFINPHGNPMVGVDSLRETSGDVQGKGSSGALGFRRGGKGARGREESSSAGDGQDSDSRLSSRAAAMNLVQEMKDLVPAGEHLVCWALVQLAGKHKPAIEEVMIKLVDYLAKNRDYVPAILALANAHVVLKQAPKARNQLKRISKMHFVDAHADEFEKSYLALAELFISSGKHDLATDLCKKALSHNRSCAIAWEYLGFIMEKEQSYADAAEHYEWAFELGDKSSCRIGYRLAFNYLKAKRMLDAVIVCNRVLTIDPSFPKIQKEILDKARADLRT